jgi:hypothetical protein
MDFRLTLKEDLFSLVGRHLVPKGEGRNAIEQTAFQ